MKVSLIQKTSILCLSIILLLHNKAYPIFNPIRNQLVKLATTYDPLYKDLFKEEAPLDYFQNLNERKVKSQFKKQDGQIVSAPEEGVRLYMGSLWTTLNKPEQPRYTPKNIEDFVNRLSNDFESNEREPLINARINVALTKDTLNQTTKDTNRYTTHILRLKQLKKDIENDVLKKNIELEGSITYEQFKKAALEEINQEITTLSIRQAEMKLQKQEVMATYQKELVQQNKVLSQLIAQKEEELKKLSQEVGEKYQETYQYIAQLKEAQNGIKMRLKQAEQAPLEFDQSIIADLKDRISSLDLEIAMRYPPEERDIRKLESELEELRIEQQSARENLQILK